MLMWLPTHQPCGCAERTDAAKFDRRVDPPYPLGGLQTLPYDDKLKLLRWLLEVHVQRLDWARLERKLAGVDSVRLKLWLKAQISARVRATLIPGAAAREVPPADEGAADVIDPLAPRRPNAPVQSVFPLSMRLQPVLICITLAAVEILHIPRHQCPCVRAAQLRPLPPATSLLFNLSQLHVKRAHGDALEALEGDASTAEKARRAEVQMCDKTPASSPLAISKISKQTLKQLPRSILGLAHAGIKFSCLALFQSVMAQGGREAVCISDCSGHIYA
jgi:hypothetical protein